jgi:hypothetical protein
MMIDAVVSERGPNSVQGVRLKELMVSASGFAFDPQNGLTFMVNPTGTDVIRWLNEGLSGDRVVERMQREYDVDEHTARRDYESFLFSLRQNALV